MRKPLSSAGGRAVCVWNDQNSLREIPDPVYFQQFREGSTLSAVFLRAGESVELLGMTRQLVGHEWSKASEPFLYCGSIGPLVPDRSELELHERMCRRLTDAVELLAARSGLRGIFGVDFIQDGRGIPWILEVNPRYTASVEVLELALQKSLLFVPRMPAHLRPSVESAPAVVAKVILYAQEPLTAPDLRMLSRSRLPGGSRPPLRKDKGPDLGEVPDSRSAWQVPALADVPVPGTSIQATWPICTVMATGSTEVECLRSLRDRVDTVWKMVNDRANEFPITTVHQD